ncbi:hypothetical protein EAJ02_15320 [Phocaeicola dorei]|nr:hypothetical protein EAJ02_15320 [Phocaeicola dorei]
MHKGFVLLRNDGLRSSAFFKKRIKMFFKKLLFFLKKAVIFFEKLLIFLKNVLVFEVEFYSGHIRFHILF